MWEAAENVLRNSGPPFKVRNNITTRIIIPTIIKKKTYCSLFPFILKFLAYSKGSPVKFIL